MSTCCGGYAQAGIKLIMERKKTEINTEGFPAEISGLLQGFAVYDSSCSKEAKVFFIERDEGFYLKIAAAKTLEAESILTKYFYSLGLSAEVCLYVQSDKDYMITRRIPGEDATAAIYLSNPKKLCEVFAQTLAGLHKMDFSGCPVKSKTSSLIPNSLIQNPEYTALIHGDYCLPNILLEDFKFTGLIDLDHAGIGDPHRDIVSAFWTLNRNLKTDKYNDLFLDCYGKNKIDPDRLRLWEETYGKS